jgi:hypothetical protein
MKNTAPQSWATQKRWRKTTPVCFLRIRTRSRAGQAGRHHETLIPLRVVDCLSQSPLRIQTPTVRAVGVFYFLLRSPEDVSDLPTTSSEVPPCGAKKEKGSEKERNMRKGRPVETAARCGNPLKNARIPTACLKKPPQNRLRLFHSFNRPGGGPLLFLIKTPDPL